MKPYRKLETQFNFDLLSAIPIDDLQRIAADQNQREEDRSRLANFVKLRWARLLEISG
jgi:hypothetical protein